MSNKKISDEQMMEQFVTELQRYEQAMEQQQQSVEEEQFFHFVEENKRLSSARLRKELALLWLIAVPLIVIVISLLRWEPALFVVVQVTILVAMVIYFGWKREFKKTREGGG